MEREEQEVDKIIEELRSKEEAETEIKVNIERGFSPLLYLTHEGFTIKWAIPYYIEINEKTEGGIKTLEIYGDYYSGRQINSNLEKALRYHIFKLKKPFFIYVPKGEMVSRSGDHKVLDNIYLEDNQIYQATLKDFIKFPPSEGLYPEDLKQLDKTGEQYIALVHYNLLFLLNDIKRYYGNEIQFNLSCSCDSSGIASFLGEIPFRAIESTIFKGASIKSNMAFKMLKSHTFIIIYNFGEEALKLWIGRNREIVIPSGKAYYKLYY